MEVKKDINLIIKTDIGETELIIEGLRMFLRHIKDSHLSDDRQTVEALHSKLTAAVDNITAEALRG